MAERQQVLARVILKDSAVASLSSFIGAVQLLGRRMIAAVQLVEALGVAGRSASCPRPATSRDGRTKRIAREGGHR
ncbi:MAG TPA: hypothetical protein VHT71_20830 [Methylomirabilota bacterium]|nr:hypothetical protein [Methylomirabilota bacterium]